MYSNANGTYMGDRTLDPVMELINNKSSTIFVHPASPACLSVALGWPAVVVEYAFESTRVVENLLLTGQRADYSNISMVIPSGAGTVPFIADSIAGLANMTYLESLNIETTLAQLKGYIVDTAAASNVIQLFGMKKFFGTDKIVLGTDCELSQSLEVLRKLME